MLYTAHCCRDKKKTSLLQAFPLTLGPGGALASPGRSSCRGQSVFPVVGLSLSYRGFLQVLPKARFTSRNESRSGDFSFLPTAFGSPSVPQWLGPAGGDSALPHPGGPEGRPRPGPEQAFRLISVETEVHLLRCATVTASERSS